MKEEASVQEKEVSEKGEREEEKSSVQEDKEEGSAKEGAEDGEEEGSAKEEILGESIETHDKKEEKEEEGR